MEKLLIVCGPTASGKTALALDLAKKYNGELVNADSRQLYEGLGVVTGKDVSDSATPTIVERFSYKGSTYLIKKFEMNGIPIWLYDLIPSHISVSIAIYQVAARLAIDHIRKKGKLPILVGGSGLYIRSIVDTIDTIQVPQDEQLRAKLTRLTVVELQDVLSRVDSEKFAHMNHSDKHNPRRLVRAIEVAQSYKKVTNKRDSQVQPSVDTFWIGLRHTEESLRSAIANRVTSRWENGAIEEVRVLRIANNSPSIMTSLGVTSILAYVDGTCTASDAKAAWVREEAAYAKRQMVWFRKNPQIVWFDVSENTLYDQVEKRVDAWYTKF